LALPDLLATALATAVAGGLNFVLADRLVFVRRGAGQHARVTDRRRRTLTARLNNGHVVSYTVTLPPRRLPAATTADGRSSRAA
jgi:putative flippase GtrA